MYSQKIRELKDIFFKIEITKNKDKNSVDKFTKRVHTAEKGVGIEEGPIEERQPE